MEEPMLHFLTGHGNSPYKYYLSLSTQSNPVLVALGNRKIGADGLGEIISQYLILSERLVYHTRVGIEQLETFTESELSIKREITEAQSFLTNTIFCRTKLQLELLRELNLNVSGLPASSNVIHLLDQVREGLSERSIAFIIGILYGLACTGVSEVKIVSAMISEYTGMTDRRLGLAGTDIDLLLNIHMHDEKKKYQSALTKIIERTSAPALRASGIKSGFHYALSEVDRWWKVCSLTYRVGVSGAILRACFADQTSTGFCGLKRITVR